MTNKIIGVIAVVALLLGGYSTYRLSPKGETYGTAGGLLIENYVPAILYNDGYKSEKEIVLIGANGDLSLEAGQLGIGTTSPSTNGDVVIDGTGTTTLKISSSTSTKGGCIELETVTGGVVKITVSGTTISAVAGTCK